MVSFPKQSFLSKCAEMDSKSKNFFVIYKKLSRGFDALPKTLKTTMGNFVQFLTRKWLERSLKKLKLKGEFSKTVSQTFGQFALRSWFFNTFATFTSQNFTFEFERHNGMLKNELTSAEISFSNFLSKLWAV